jgi:(1->4)-alpha-D-glucan 1-alpha-D-glucosylmutase
MKIPIATYRIQFSPSFGFKDASLIVPYLADLGISDIYASPIFKAVKASLHGYDVVDPTSLNPELGELSDFEDLADTLKNHNMGWIQDIVPNHMAMDSENHLLMDIFENGHNSKYFKFFDVDWDHQDASLNNRILAPFLGKFYGQCLEDKEITLEYSSEGFKVTYYNISFPLRVESYLILLKNVATLKYKLSENDPDYLKILGMLYVLKALSSSEDVEERSSQVKLIHRTLWELYNSNAAIYKFIDEVLLRYNGVEGKADSFNALDDLLSQQLFRLSFWKVAAEEINYRRFFCINGLISLRMEDQEVFNYTHRLVFDLIERQIITGLRIDHVDGLYDPTSYLQQMRDRVKSAYIIVEKILSMNEALPPSWPIQGTTGYDFLNYIIELFCQEDNENTFSKIYSSITETHNSYLDVVHDNKKLMIQEDMASDVHNLALLLKKISGRDRHGSDITLNALQRALTEVLAVFPVYRTYINQVMISDDDRKCILTALDNASTNFPALLHGFTFVRRFLLLDFPEYVSEDERKEWLRFAMKFQQLTGPVMAKGVEDTTHYVYTRLLSLNEVGGRPENFGCSLDKFHNFIKNRKDLWPYSLNATSTHDTKRGEDARARINVLSEIPNEWLKNLRTWIKINKNKKEHIRGFAVPDKNDEYFLYQTLIGSWQLSNTVDSDFVARIKTYIVKAVREAKVHTAWLKPDIEYENAYISFVDKILSRSEANLFLKEFLPFCQKISHFGILNSLSQTLIKITSPGVPDFYQGSELWDLSLVDPDNRRPVDFKYRQETLAYFRETNEDEVGRLVIDLLSSKEDGRIKLFLIYMTLKAKIIYPDIFRYGDYVVLDTMGRFKNHVITYAWRYQRQWVLIIAPRFFSYLVPDGELPLGDKIWKDTEVVMPNGSPVFWRNVITNEIYYTGKVLYIKDILSSFPVAMLMGDGK